MRGVGATQPKLTYADLERMPDDGKRYELYDGELRVVPAPIPLHQLVALRLSEALGRHVRNGGGLLLFSPIDIVFAEDTVLEPDLLLFRPERRHLVPLRSVIRHPPDLVVEILSPSTARHDRTRKMAVYARFRVPEYWIVDPDARRAEVHALREGRYERHATAGPSGVVQSATLEGLRCDVGTLWSD